MEQFAAFATANNIEMTATRIPNRSGDAWESRAGIPDPIHFHVLLTVTIGGKLRTLWSGEYSQGIGIVERWAEKNIGKFSFMSTGTTGHSGYPMKDAIRGKHKFAPESAYYENLRIAYAKAVSEQGTGAGVKSYTLGSTTPSVAKAKPIVLPVADLLHCLQLDCMGCDQNFEDWAGDLGYSADSIKAKEIWEDCNKIRRGLRDALGAKFEEFEALEEE